MSDMFLEPPALTLDKLKELVECQGCHKRPEELAEYTPAFTGAESTDADFDPRVYVIHEEGTLNTSNGHFLCTDCYIKAGQPANPHGWVCP